ncbi:MAG: TIGR03986 family CRISPR-associated RAMP protein [Hyphomicrobiaceae bacterium]|nr:TIGR03986 family CRISPR-associated RAMP protein [Hyphomicrobiaceae bacterium]
MSHAPYNFVRLSKAIYRPRWAKQISHDLPFSDGLSGVLHLTLKNDTPLLVAKERTKGAEQQPAEAHFFRLPDGPNETPGTYAIPGSSVRGMVRNVLEIAAFAKMQLVDDKRYGLRDLAPTASIDYRDKLTGRNNGAFAPKARAGWLTFNSMSGDWQIHEVDFARIDHDQFAFINKEFAQDFQGLRATDDQERPAAPQIYEMAKTRAINGLRSFEVECLDRGHRHSKGKRLWYRKAYAWCHAPADVETTSRAGTLVFTGQPSTKKHMEFVFFQPDPEAMPRAITRDVWSTFIDIHEKGEKESTTWKHWRDQYLAGTTKRIPIFFLADSARPVKSLGLAMMFKMPHAMTVHQTVAQTNTEHLPGDGNGLDLVEAMFGRVGATPETTLKGRVSFGLLRRKSGSNPGQGINKILAAPKPSYFPHYVRQVDFVVGSDATLHKKTNGEGKEVQAQYRSYMDDGPRYKAEIRGWKRYPVRRFDPLNFQPDLPPNGNNGQLTKLHPLPAGQSFEGEIRFHNLKPVELGALLWALTFGQQGDEVQPYRHSLGMGRPFGFGVIGLEIELAKTTIAANDGAVHVSELQQYVVDFRTAMGVWSTTQATIEPDLGSGWDDSPQLKCLLAMADPRNATPTANLQYMRLQVPGVNQFADAKKRGDVLPEYARLPPKREINAGNMKR